MKIAIAGCSGRMGQTLIAAVRATQDVTLAGGSEREAFKADFPVVTSAEELVAMSDAVIDFTAPEATLAVAKAMAAKGGIHIIGTTGFEPTQQKELESLAGKLRIVQSGNFSLGVNLLQVLVEQAARTLSDDYDIELFEMHHKHKKDAPSGTALMLGRAAAKGRGVNLEDKKIAGRDGITGERKRGDIGFSVARGGDVVGSHSVFFAGPGEVIELKHDGFSREIYANGAIKAAIWAADKKPGLYSMRDVLGL